MRLGKSGSIIYTIMAAAANKAPIPEGFPEPLGFLNEFAHEGDAYQGLYAHIARQLDMGDESSVRDYVDSLTLSTRAQGEYIDVLRSTLEIRHTTTNKSQYKPHYPELDAAINYMQYRLALGVLEPAVSIALGRTNPDHTRVRIARTIVAVNLVRNWMLDAFSGPKSAASVPGLLDQEIEGYLRQYFNGEYDQVGSTSPQLADMYRDSGYALPSVDRSSDGYRLYDIKDHTFRILHKKPNGDLPSADEVYEIQHRRAPQPPKLVSEDVPRVTLVAYPPAQETSQPLTPYARERVRRQVLIQALGGLGVLQPAALRALDLVEHVPAAERLLPAGHLGGRAAARTAAHTLLMHLHRHGIDRVEPTGTRRPVARPTVAEVRTRLDRMLADNRAPWLPADALLMAADASYRQKYGEGSSRRDFWE